MKEITIQATLENLDKVREFIDGELKSRDCPVKTQMQIDIAVEELYVNVVHYAYQPGTGEVTVRCSIEGEPAAAVIQFADRGRAYNPLAKEDPDITLSAEERAIGGLGIYMVKKSMDSMEYAYEDGQNILTIMKRLV